MQIRKHSGIFTLETEQLLPVSLEKAWTFFSNPANLQVLTPKDFDFKITSKLSDKIYQGQVITYKISILPFLKSNWVTEITFIKEKLYFVDEQRFGPYKMWHHEHFFEEQDGKTLMIDKVSFALPLGILGKLAYHLFVKRKLTRIFEFRAQIIQEVFSNKNA